jgi:hypothetical protein
MVVGAHRVPRLPPSTFRRPGLGSIREFDIRGAGTIGESERLHRWPLGSTPFHCLTA